MRGEEVRSYADRRRAARCDGDRVRGHGAAQARGQPCTGHADPGALLAEAHGPRRGSASGSGARRTSGSTSSTTRGRSCAARSGRASSARRFHQFAWDGRNDAGQIVPDGVYHVQLELKDEDRTIEFPSTVRVDSTPPTIERRRSGHQLFSPDGDQRADHVNVRYTFGEQAYAILYVERKAGRPELPEEGDRDAIRGTATASGRATTGSRSAAQDLAGNIAGVDARVHRPAPLHRPLQAQVHACAAGSCASASRPTRRRVGWRLGRTRGNAKPPLLRLPVPSKPGRYTLTVTANGHRARATVVVRK